jgi:hypothetical protein
MMMLSLNAFVNKYIAFLKKHLKKRMKRTLTPEN